MKINFPGNCETEVSRMGYCRRRIHLLTELQNIMGEWHKDGITEIKYNNLPDKIKGRYPYQSKLTASQYEDFWNNVYKPLEKTIHYEFNKNQDIADNSTYWGTPDFDDGIDTNAS